MLRGAPRSARIARTMGLGVGLLLAIGCTRANPVFGDTEGDPTAGSDGAPSSTSSLPPTSSGEVPDGTGMGATSSGEPPIDTTGVPPIDTTGVEPTMGEPTCSEPSLEPIHITVTDENGVVQPPEPCGRKIVRSNGIITGGADELLHQSCDACDCPTGPALWIDFGGSLRLPAVPDCGKLVIWSALGPDGACRWDGVAVIGQNETVIPSYIAMNSTGLPEENFGPVLVDLMPQMLCDGDSECALLPGEYALKFFDGPAVAQGTTEVVTIGFVAGVDFEVTNRMSFVDATCIEHVAWTAQMAL